MAKFPFIGASYTLAEVQADCQRSMNFYPEVVESGAGKNRVIDKRTPGITTFTTLPKSPVRAVWAGEFRLFAVAGDTLYEIFVDTTFTARGTVGTDGKPAQILANGNQLLVISAGLVYCDEGAGPVQVFFASDAGTVDTVGTAVTWVSGDNFSDVNPGDAVLIHGTTFAVVSVAPDGLSMVVNTSAGTWTGIAWAGYALNGSVHVTSIGGGLSEVDIVGTGSDPFPNSLAGSTIYIAAVPYTVAQVNSPTQLIISATVTLASAHYSANSPVIASTGTYLDGYFIVSQPNSRLFNISALDDGTTWSGLDVASKEGYPDNISALRADHEQLWILGDEVSTEVWQDTGAANFPLQRIPGAFVQMGCAAPFSLVRLGSAVGWLGVDQERGGFVAYMAQGFQPLRVSNHAVEAKWNTYSTVNDVVAYTYIEDGHEFWVLNFPTANATWVYDVVASAQSGMALWHERGWWNGASIDRQRGNFQAFVCLGAASHTAQHYVGDWQNGKIYTANQTTLSDAGTAIHRIRTCPHLATENLRTFYHRFELMAQVNSGVLNPVMDYSVDYGQTFINPQSRTTNQPGLTNQFLARLIWRRLGMSRDRVFRVTVTDAVDFALVDGYYEATQGIS